METRSVTWRINNALGNKLKRDFCLPKYCSQRSVFAESVPPLIAVVIVAFFSGNLFNASGMDLAITLVIEIIFAALLYGFAFIMFRGMKRRLAETYISVCENGVCGICPQNGYKNREFSLRYSEITKVVVKGEAFNSKYGCYSDIICATGFVHDCGNSWVE